MEKWDNNSIKEVVGNNYNLKEVLKSSKKVFSVAVSKDIEKTTAAINAEISAFPINVDQLFDTTAENITAEHIYYELLKLILDGRNIYYTLDFRYFIECFVKKISFNYTESIICMFQQLQNEYECAKLEGPRLLLLSRIYDINYSPAVPTFLLHEKITGPYSLLYISDTVIRYDFETGNDGLSRKSCFVIKHPSLSCTKFIIKREE